MKTPALRGSPSLFIIFIQTWRFPASHRATPSSHPGIRVEIFSNPPSSELGGLGFSMRSTSMDLHDYDRHIILPLVDFLFLPDFSKPASDLDPDDYPPVIARSNARTEPRAAPVTSFLDSKRKTGTTASNCVAKDSAGLSSERKASKGGRSGILPFD